MKKFTDKEWLEIFQQCKSSGISDIQWCKDNNIPPSTFYYRLKKLRNESSGPVVTESKTMIPEYHEVIPLIVQDDNSVQKPVVSETMPSIQISFGSIKLDIYNTADRNLIAETLMAVKSVC